MESFSYYDLGRIEYGEALDLQTNSFQSLIDAKRKGLEEKNCLYFCVHNPVLTLGKSGKETNLLVPELLLKEKGVSLFHIDRGGDITYHGPGQITGYPVFDLDGFGMGLKAYIHTLEDIVIEFLLLYGVKAEKSEASS